MKQSDKLVIYNMQIIIYIIIWNSLNAMGMTLIELPAKPDHISIAKLWSKRNKQDANRQIINLECISLPERQT